MRHYVTRTLKKAAQEIAELELYIRIELDNPAAADNFIEMIYNAIELLSEFPYSYQIIPKFSGASSKHRKMVVKNYIVVYRINERKKTVYIEHVFHGARNYNKFL